MTPSTNARRIWKRSFISAVTPAIVQSNPSRKWPWAFWKRSLIQKVKVWKRQRFIFVSTENILKTEQFKNDGVPVWSCDFSDGVFLNTQIQNDWGGDCWVFKFLRGSVENIWCVFRVKPPFSNSSSVVWTLPKKWALNFLLRLNLCELPAFQKKGAGRGDQFSH